MDVSIGREINVQETSDYFLSEDTKFDYEGNNRLVPRENEEINLAGNKLGKALMGLIGETNFEGEIASLKSTIHSLQVQVAELLSENEALKEMLRR